MCSQLPKAAIAAITIFIAIAAAIACVSSDSSEASSNIEADEQTYYQFTDNTGYNYNDRGSIVSKTVAGSSNFNVKIGSSGSISTFKYDGKTSYAVSRDATITVSKIRTSTGADFGDGWHLSNDSWNLSGTDATVGTGAVYIQKKTSSGWSTIGTVSTSDKTSVTLWSDEIGKGTTVRVICLYEIYQDTWEEHFWQAGDYAGQVGLFLLGPIGWIGNGVMGTQYEGSGTVVHKTHENLDTYYNIAEVYEFSLASSNLDVSIRNESVDNTKFTDDSKVIVDACQTVKDGAMSTSKFTVIYQKNADTYVDGRMITKDTAVTAAGTHTITVKNIYKCISRTVTVIDSRTVNSLTGADGNVVYAPERAYIEGSTVPVFVGHVTITPYTPFGNVPVTLTIDGTVATKETVITTAGDHKVMYTLGRDDSGDRVTITYSFKLIEEAPGPVVNHTLMQQSCASVPLGAWAVASASGQGTAYVLYETKAAAVKAKVEYELTRVKNNGSYASWSGGDYVLKNMSPIDVRKAIEHYANEVVQFVYIDPSKDSLLLNAEGKDLSTLSVSGTVYAYGEGQFSDLKNTLVVGAKISVYDDGGVHIITTDHTFIDAFKGIDCNSVQIQQESKIVNVALGQPLLKVCRENDIAGMIIITESNIYGRTASYQVFIADGEAPVLTADEFGNITVDSDMAYNAFVYKETAPEDMQVFTGKTFNITENGEWTVYIVDAAGYSVMKTVAVDNTHNTKDSTPGTETGTVSKAPSGAIEGRKTGNDSITESPLFPVAVCIGIIVAGAAALAIKRP